MDDILINPRRRTANTCGEINKKEILEMTAKLLECRQSGALQEAFDNYVQACTHHSARPVPQYTAPSSTLDTPLLPSKTVIACLLKNNLTHKHAKPTLKKAT
jgi:hypothetical protein